MSAFFEPFELWHWLVLGALTAILIVPGLLFLSRAAIYALQDPAESRVPAEETRTSKIDRLIALRER